MNNTLFAILALFALTQTGFSLLLPVLKTIIGPFTGHEIFLRGEPAEKTPHQAALFIKQGDSTYFCGGVVIGERCILTAAHCCIKNSSITAVLGAYYITQQESTTTAYVVGEVIPHPGYNETTLRNDLCVLKTIQTIAFNDHIKAARMTTRSDDCNYVNKKALITGWGKSIFTDGITPSLRAVNVTISSNTHCFEYSPGPDDTQLCSNFLTWEGACNGDSGGPVCLFVDYLIGLVSYGHILGCTRFPNVYTNVCRFVDWIKLHCDFVQVD